MTTQTTTNIQKLDDMLTDALFLAEDIKYETEPYSKERRQFMAITSLISSAIDTVDRIERQ